MKTKSNRRIGRRALVALAFALVTAFPLVTQAESANPVSTYDFSHIKTEELRRKYEAAKAEYQAEMQKYSELKIKFQRTLALRANTNDDGGDILKHEVEATYAAQLTEITALFHKVHAMEEFLDLIAEIIASRRPPVFHTNHSPDDAMAIGRKEDARKGEKRRYDYGMIQWPAPPKSEYRAEAYTSVTPASYSAEILHTGAMGRSAR